MEPYSLVHLFACLVAATMASAIFARGPAERANQLVAATLACAAHWALCETIWNNLEDPVWVLRTIRISGFGWLTLGPLVLHLVVEVQGDTRSLARRAVPWAYASAALSGILYLSSPLFLAGVQRTSWGWGYTLGPLFPLVCLPAVGWAVFGIVRWLTVLPRGASPFERRQARWTLLAIGLTVLAAVVTDVLQPALGVPGPRLGSASTVVLCGIVAHGVTRHDYFVFAPSVLAERILGSLRDGAALLRAGPGIAAANDGLAQLVGVSAPELQGAPLLGILPGLPLDPARELRGFPTELRSRTGRTIPVAVSSAALRDKSDAPIGHVFAIRDLREMTALRNRIVTTGRLAAMGELAAGIVHEINNPIAFMRANLTSLRHLWDDTAAHLRQSSHGARLGEIVAEGEELLDESIEGIERIAGLVDSVRSFSHAGLGERELADVSALLRSAAEVAQPKLRFRKTTLEAVYAEVPPVLCAPQELRQLFVNLLLNAANAAGEGGTVRVRSSAEEDRVVVHVQDDGCGMPPEVVERVFDPIFAPKTPIGGLSIGLPACYEIVRKHGGTIRVDSEEGRGTHFRIELAAAD